LIKAEKKIILRHKSGWTIAYDYGFPSSNYIVFKAHVSAPMADLPSHNVAYCSNLSSALNRLFHELIIEHVGKNRRYCGRLQDLRKAVDDAKKDFDELLTPKGKNL
jgi:hypothetical protein